MCGNINMATYVSVISVYDAWICDNDLLYKMIPSAIIG